MSKIDNLKFLEKTGRTNLFFDGPADHLVDEICKHLKKSPFCEFFGEFIDPYKRMDYQFRNCPVMRVYSGTYSKDFDSWFINGDIRMDMILSSDIRRRETQLIQNTVSNALLQYFREPKTFADICLNVPGLNELGKRFSVNPDLGFEWQDQIAPLTQITLNFRIDLRIWDDYLEETYRDKDSPFAPVLKDLKRIVTEIVAQDDEDVSQVTVSVDQEE